MLEHVLSMYGIEEVEVRPHGSGLINHTWLVHHPSQDYILQRVNQDVFKEPWLIAANIETMADYLAQHHPGYFFVTPLKTIRGESMVFLPEHGYFRLFPFVKHSHTMDVASSPEQAFEAAVQFGRFTRMLSGLPSTCLKTTLPGFHDLVLRHAQFEEACQQGNPQRIRQAEAEIRFLRDHHHIVSTYRKLTTGGKLRLRATHHDTKISNVLFDRQEKGLCVIDLDTVMPGYFISDVGDMMRTYLSPVSEEEKDLDKVIVREAYFRAILEGYLQEMSGELNQDEISHFVYSGLFLIYMQALRFLADHLNNDRYYGASYQGHNYLRARNQIRLLGEMLDKEASLKRMVEEAINSKQ